MKENSPLVAAAHAAFGQRFGAAPDWLVWAPGRVNLIGEHIDYNDGPVLPLAIEAGVILAGRVNDSGRARVWSASMSEAAEFSVAGEAQRGEPSWSNYLRGVVAGFQGRGVAVPGFDAALVADLPHGSGLSSSAALEVATATLLEAMNGAALPLFEKALLCQRAEHEFAGVPCGIMDQCASIFGEADRLVLLDCRTHEVSRIEWPGDELEFLIIDTRVKHRLADGAYADRRRSCEAAALTLGVKTLRDLDAERLPEAEGLLDAVTFRRVRHVVTEIARTFAAADVIQRRDWAALGGLMAASHASLRDDYEVSCRELDVIVEIGAEIGEKDGLFGCRMTGGGFGGSAIAIVRPDALSSVQARIEAEFTRRIGRPPGFLATRPARGAAILLPPCATPFS